MRIAKRLMLWFGLILIGYVAIVLLIYLMQDTMVFPGAGRGRGEPLPGTSGVEVNWLSLDDGTRFRIAEARPEGDPVAVLVFFLGNGADLRSGVPNAAELAEYGVSVLVSEYPGYGDSEGEPSVASVMAVADRAGREAAERARSLGVPLIAGGISLGTFSAVHLARAGRVSRLLLASPPTSVAETGARHYPWLPVRMLVRHRFDNTTDVERIECPTLVLHGDQDSTVPTDMGRRVAEALGGEFHLVPGHGHHWLFSTVGPAARRVRSFLRGE